MGILESFERGLERAVNGVFAKTFRSGLQPVELTSALRKELDTKAAVVSRDRILAPNDFVLYLAPGDFERMRGLGSELDVELVNFVKKHAEHQHYRFPGVVSVRLEEDDHLSTGILEIESNSVHTEVSWQPRLEINGTRYPLTHARTVVGRGSEADITVEDTGISRRHVEIGWDGERAVARDLGSTNGTKLNGAPLGQAVLNPGDVLTIGRAKAVFDVVPHSSKRGAR